MCFKAIWNFLWKSNSVLSWIVDIVLIFLIVKFVIFPLAGLVLGTSLPFVIIESRSMEHEGPFDYWFSLHGRWYIENNITAQEIKDYWPWQSGLNKGDIVVVKGSRNKDYKKGDVIIFKIKEQKTPIIHRIIKIEEKNTNGTIERIFSTKGDHNDGQLPYELEIKSEQIIGKAWFRVPWLGWMKLFFVELLK
ncbi:MAG: signal peptidase I [Candidatus Pacearchaeota archaeon]|nr:signal peptidase I [Candidatus Pacearchaeota archaeon]